MRSSVTSLFRTALYAQQTSEVVIVLLTIDHTSMSSPLRMTSDSVNTVSNGNVFLPVPFDLVLPSEEDGKMPEAQLTIENVSRQLVDEVRSLSSAPSVLMDIVMSGDTDTVIAQYPDFTLHDVTYDAIQITGRITLEDFLNEPYPPTIQSAATHPGLF